MAVVTWGNSASTSNPPARVDFFPINLNSAEPIISGSKLLTASLVGSWRLAVYAHSHASDDHIKVLYCSPDEGSEPKKHLRGVDVTDDRLAIRVPNATGDEDNFVRGLGFDLTAQGVTVPHPTDPTAEDLPPQPVLWVMTSDGVLRAYTFGSLGDRDIIVADEVPAVPETPLHVAKEEMRIPIRSKEAIAATTALPSDDEIDELSEEEEEIRKAPPSSKALDVVKKELPAKNIFAPSSASKYVLLEEPKGITEAVAPVIAPSRAMTPVVSSPPPLVAPPVARSQTTVPPASQRLKSASAEVAALEKDFLRSLKDTRHMEAALYDALKDVVKGADVPASKREVEAIRYRIEVLHTRVQDATRMLSEMQREFGTLVAGVKEAYTRTAAMPAFRKDSGVSVDLERAQELKRKQPLDPILSTMRNSANTNIKVLMQKLAEVEECVSTCEERQRRLRSGQSLPIVSTEAQILSLFDSINAQKAVIRSQALKLDELTAVMRTAGLLSSDSSIGSHEMWNSMSSRHAPGGSPGDEGESGGGLAALRLTLSPRAVGRDTPSPLSSSSLLHVDSSSRRARRAWTPVRETSMASGSPGPKPLLALTAREKDNQIGDGILSLQPYSPGTDFSRSIDAIVHRCRGIDGGIRVTEVGLRPAGLNDGSRRIERELSTKSPPAWLPALHPLTLPELPEPYMPKAVEHLPPLSGAEKIATQQPMALERPTAPSLKPLVSQVEAKVQPQTMTVLTTKPVSAQPPLPTASQMQAASKLGAKVLGSQPAVAPPKPVSSSAQPPIPSMAQVTAAKGLMSKAAAAAEARAEAASAAVKSEPTNEDALVATNANQAFSFSLSPSSTAAPAVPSTARFSFSSASAPSFGAVSASSAPSFGFGSLGLGAPTAATATATSEPLPFGKGLPFGASTGFGATSSASASTTVFGSTAATQGLGLASTATAIFGGQQEGTCLPTGSLFSSSVPTPGGAASPFGAISAAAAPSAPSPFGFGGSSTGSPVGTPSSATSSSTGTGLFGVSSGFGVSPATTPLFGSSPSSSVPMGFGTGAVAAALPPSSPSSVFGQQAAFGRPSAFGQPASPAPAFGAPSSFGTPGVAPGFGQPAAFGQQPPSPAPAFGQAAHVGGGFGAFASTQPSGFSAFSSQSSAGFGGLGGSGSGFGGVATGTPTPKPPASGAMWQPRK